MGERNWGGQMTALEARFDKFTKGYGCDTAIDFVGRAGGRRQQAGPGALLYGEIEFCALAMLFRSLRVDHGLLTKRGGRFLDIGSGLGKTVIAAALLHEFDACTGVEIVDKHWARSQVLGKAWAKKCGRGASKKTGLWGRKNTRVASSESKGAVTVDYVLGDALEHDWSKADVVFINCTYVGARIGGERIWEGKGGRQPSLLKSVCAILERVLAIVVPPPPPPPPPFIILPWQAGFRRCPEALTSIMDPCLRHSLQYSLTY